MVRPLSALLPLAIVAGALAITPAASAKDSTTTIHFAHGATSASLNGSLKGYDSANFLIGAQANQVMKVTFQPNNASCYFNVYAPSNSQSAIFIGSSEGNTFSGTLAESGTYKVQAYLMRNEARRGATCKFTLSVSVTGGEHASTISEDHMRGECKGAAAGLYGLKPVYIKLDNNGHVNPASDGFSIEGTADKGNEGIKHFNCIFDTGRRLKEVMPLDSDGE